MSRQAIANIVEANHAGHSQSALRHAITKALEDGLIVNTSAQSFKLTDHGRTALGGASKKPAAAAEKKVATASKKTAATKATPTKKRKAPKVSALP